MNHPRTPHRPLPRILTLPDQMSSLQENHVFHIHQLPDLETAILETAIVQCKAMNKPYSRATESMPLQGLQNPPILQPIPSEQNGIAQQK